MDENPNTTDANEEITLSFDNEGEDTAEQKTAPVESSTTETKESEQAETKETEAESTEDSGDTEESEEETTEETDEDKPKAKNKAENRIRTLVSEKRELQRQVEQLTAQNYKPATVAELQEQGLDETDAKLEAMRQEQTIDKYNQHVVELTNDLNMESMQVLYDFPVFNPESKDYDADFAKMASEQYMEVSGIQTDPKTGQIVNANVLPYKFYETLSKIHERGAQRGQISGKRAAEKQLAATDTTGTSTTQKATSDPIMDILLKGLDD